MILPDANVLLYAVNSAAPQHRQALVAMERAYETARGVGHAWNVLLAFLRISTRRGIFPRPLSVDDSLEAVKTWIEHPAAQIVDTGERHLEILATLLRSAGTAGNLTSDAHLAALAIEHDATLLTFDRDFARFPDLKWKLPTVP